MRFINIQQRLPTGRRFSDHRHCSSLIIYNKGLQVLGVIPNGSLIRPTTAMQRDMWIAHLQELKFDESKGDEQ